MQPLLAVRHLPVKQNLFNLWIQMIGINIITWNTASKSGSHTVHKSYNYSHHLSPSKPGGNLFTQKYDSFNSDGYNLALWTTLEVYFNLVLMEPLYENIISLIVIASSSECIVFLKPLQHLAVILVCLVQRF